jgi:hypothetical protein
MLSKVQKLPEKLRVTLLLSVCVCNFSKNILSKRVAYKMLLKLNPGQPDLTGKDDFNDDEAETEATPPVGSRGYHNLETFQRKKLRQKVKIKTTIVIK